MFKNVLADGGYVRALKLTGQSMTRKEIDEATTVAKHAGAGGLAYLIFEDGGVRSPIAKFLTEKEIATVKSRMQAEDGDMVFFAAGNYSLVCKVLNKIRLHLRDKYELADPNELSFCFVIDFPFYEFDETTGKYDFGHNPFSHVVGGVEALDTDDLETVQTNQYDLVLNGFEMGSGSIRNHKTEVLIKAFEKV